MKRKKEKGGKKSKKKGEKMWGKMKQEREKYKERK